MELNLIVIFFTVFLGLVLSDPKIVHWNDEIKRKRYIFIICILLILQSGLRHVAVGADTYAYYRDFNWVKGDSWNTLLNNFTNYYRSGIGKDPGYDIFQKLFQVISGNYHVYLLFIAMLFFSSLGYFLYRNTETIRHLMFAFVLYSALFYSFFSITGHRQTIATAAVLFSYELIKRRKLLTFLIIILLASTIHRSCLIFLPFYFLYNFKKPDFLLSVALLIFPVLMYYRMDVSDFVKTVSAYRNYGFYEGAGTYTFTAMLLLAAILVWWRMKYVLNENESTKPYFNAFVFAIVLTPLTWVNPSAMRAVQYYSIFMLVMIPYIADSFNSSVYNLRRIAYMLAITALVILFINSGSDIEYRFFWQEMELGPNYPHRWAIIE